MEVVLVFVVFLLVTQNALAVEVDEGEESVVLPCQAPPAKHTSVLWSRNDLSPSTVHLREAQDNLQNQNSLFSKRTSMKSDALQTGDVSLTLTQLQLLDSGTYTCTVRGGGSTDVSQVTLTVNRKKDLELQKQGPEDKF
ncbi:V-set domain containing T-cell activation inhibitor 1-like isoform X2 [Channa argus]|uniref:V-set domain containing T-cell activation inhibitor 1-like isoform X2 n=1 Tax=Channa argus TaxID=215402 RepID=UPI003522E46B